MGLFHLHKLVIESRDAMRNLSDGVGWDRDRLYQRHLRIESAFCAAVLKKEGAWLDDGTRVERRDTDGDGEVHLMLGDATLAIVIPGYKTPRIAALFTVDDAKETEAAIRRALHET